MRKRMYEWQFTPDAADIERCKGAVCSCTSGYTYETESKAIWHGKMWLKETNGMRTGTITAIPETPKPSYSYIIDY